MEIELEIAHVLLIEIVRYSKLLVDEQRDSLHKLNEIVRGTDSFCATDAAGKPVRLPTGDGMVRGFCDPASCACRLREAQTWSFTTSNTGHACGSIRNDPSVSGIGRGKEAVNTKNLLRLKGPTGI